MITTKYYTNTLTTVKFEVDALFTSKVTQERDAPPPFPPPNDEFPEVIQLPKFITILKDSYDWNIQKTESFGLKVYVNNITEYLRYYFLNQPGADEDNSITATLMEDSSGKYAYIKLENPIEVGSYELRLIIGNEANKDSESQSSFIQIFQEITYGEPDVTKISYAKNINEADLKPLIFDFEFELETVNTQFVEVLFEDTIIGEFSVTDNKVDIIYHAKDLHDVYQAYFVDKGDTYEVTFSFRPYFNGIAERIYGKNESVTVFVTKARYLLSLDYVLNKFEASFNELFSGNDTRHKYEDLIIFEDDRYLYYRIRMDKNSYVISNTGEDNITFSYEGDKFVQTEFKVDEETGDTERVQKDEYGSLVVKLLEPLPATIEPNMQVWIAKQILPSIVETILLTDEDEEDCVVLKPNFYADVVDEAGYEYLDQIIASGSVTSDSLVRKYLNDNDLSLDELNIEYFDGTDTGSANFIQFNNFVNYSSAKVRIDNYQYKLSAIEFWKSQIDERLEYNMGQSTASFSIITSQSFVDKIENVKSSFDAFESILYSGFDIKSSNTTFFEVQSEYAVKYDIKNKNYFIRHLPVYLTTDSENEEFITFLEMIGQHFDVVWSYIKGLNRVKKISHKASDGIPDKFLYSLLENLGWDPGQPFSSQQLWKEAFGLNKDGTTPYSTNTLGESVPIEFTTEDARHQVWRRILNNLPYLLKHKGTRRSINAIMACYGVPSSLLTIVEFGGPSKNPGDINKFTYEDRTAALVINKNDNLSTAWNGEVVDSVQLRFKTSEKQETQLLRVGDPTDYWRVYMTPTYTGSYGTITFEATSTAPIVLTLTGSSGMGIALFDDYYKTLTVQREQYESASLQRTKYSIILKEAVDDRISFAYTEQIDFLDSAYPNLEWNNTNSQIFVGNSIEDGITGTIDEFRLWNEALSGSAITSHTLNPDVIHGNGIYSSTDNLLFRLDFEYPKDRQSDPYVKNVSPSVAYGDTLDSNSKEVVLSGYYGYATASMTEVKATYPYHYDAYERNVTAEIPSIGFVGRDKVRLEDIELISNLTHKGRSTKKSLDRAPVDSNKLGLFFSPVKELNMDILRSLGPINIGDFIGDWEDEYGTDRYKDLDTLRNYYFQRTNLNFNEYIKLVKSIDKSLFDMLLQVIPARAKVARGLLFESSVLERSKIKINKPISINILHTASLDTTETQEIDTEYPNLNVVIDGNKDININTEVPIYSSTIDYNDETEIEAEEKTLSADIDFLDISNLNSSIIYNSGSTMGGIEIGIDLELGKATIVAEYELENSYQSIGNDPDSPFNKGFGVVADNGALDRTYFRADGTLVLTERNNAYILTIKYSRTVPIQDGVSVIYEKIDRFVKKLIFIDQFDKVNDEFRSPSTHSFYTSTLANLGTSKFGEGVVTAIELFDGYTTGHYRYVNGLSRGMKLSFFEGSKQTSETTIDKTPAVEIFATNPNALRVSDAGRGAGEPILIAD